jgi:hypothetical protein
MNVRQISAQVACTAVAAVFDQGVWVLKVEILENFDLLLMQEIDAPIGPSHLPKDARSSLARRRICNHALATGIVYASYRCAGLHRSYPLSEISLTISVA